MRLEGLVDTLGIQHQQLHSSPEELQRAAHPWYYQYPTTLEFKVNNGHTRYKLQRCLFQSAPNWKEM